MPLEPRLSPRDNSVLAVLVAYCGDAIATARQVGRLEALGFVDVVVVDNSESVDACNALSTALDDCRAEVVQTGINRGVGAAHNLGLSIAKQRGYRAALLLDQDSVVEQECVYTLLSELNALQGAGIPVAAVGAVFTDPRTGWQSQFLRLRGLRMTAVTSQRGEPVPCDFLISSATMVNVNALVHVGLMADAYFIDFVDVEWCARARSRGYHVYGVPAAHFLHTIGDNSVSFGGRPIAVHGPQRQYYRVRNALLLARSEHVSLALRVHLILRALADVVFFCLACAPRLERGRWLLRGVWDGILGRAGRLGGTHGLRPRKSQGPEREPDTVSMGPSSAEANEAEVVS